MTTETSSEVIGSNPKSQHRKVDDMDGIKSIIHERVHRLARNLLALTSLTNFVFGSTSRWLVATMVRGDDNSFDYIMNETPLPNLTVYGLSLVPLFGAVMSHLAMRGARGSEEAYSDLAEIFGDVSNPEPVTSE
jgi:hypothetical protein